MITLLISLSFTLAFWKTVLILTRPEPVKKSYPSAVNKKLAMDFEQIKNL